MPAVTVEYMLCNETLQDVTLLVTQALATEQKMFMLLSATTELMVNQLQSARKGVHFLGVMRL